MQAIVTATKTYAWGTYTYTDAATFIAGLTKNKNLIDAVIAAGEEANFKVISGVDLANPITPAEYDKMRAEVVG